MSELTPREIVQELDRHIIGQDEAKRAVAIALRNRWRRLQLPQALREEVAPKNILMIGPTGVGKTEIARRLAKLAHAPFIKVEATKFTEVGYVGRDVESIIRDLMDVAVKMSRMQAQERVRHNAEEAAEERLLDALLPAPRPIDVGFSGQEAAPPRDSTARQHLRKQLREGDLNDREVEIEMMQSYQGAEIMAPPGLEEMAEQLRTMFSGLASGRRKAVKLSVKEALRRLCDEEAEKLIDEDKLTQSAVSHAEQSGIVFLDEIDKVTRYADTKGADVSREGVQRDLLPLIEGCTVSTRYGMVRTDHILFIASGAFHLSKPSDLIPELQGRLPIRVEFTALTPEQFQRILTEPKASLTEQYAALLGTEGVTLKLTDDAIARIAELAWQVNERTENIGARRLHTVMERLLEQISFDADGLARTTHTVDASYVDKQLQTLAADEDLTRYIL